MHSLQYMVREHLVEEGSTYEKKAGHGIIRKNIILSVDIIIHVGFVGPTEMLHMRWNSQHGTAYVDGSHMKVSE